MSKKIECVYHKHIYSMDVGDLGDVLVVCVGISAMWMGYVQACRYQRTFYYIFNPKLNRRNFDLPNRLSI